MRTNALTYKREGLIYPGQYNPMPQIKSLIERMKITQKSSGRKMAVEIKEQKDCFQLEIALPAVKRENIFIRIDNHILSIAVLTKDCTELKIKKLPLHQYASGCIKRNILLPENADSEFISAEYRKGYLVMHIPKTGKPSKTEPTEIVVY